MAQDRKAPADLVPEEAAELHQYLKELLDKQTAVSHGATGGIIKHTIVSPTAAKAAATSAITKPAVKRPTSAGELFRRVCTVVHTRGIFGYGLLR